MNRDVAGESTVTERFWVTIPPAVRREAGVEPGDMIRWRVDDAGSLSVELRRQPYGAFDDLDAVDIGESTDVADEMDTEAVDFD